MQKFRAEANVGCILLGGLPSDMHKSELSKKFKFEIIHKINNFPIGFCKIFIFSFHSVKIAAPLQKEESSNSKKLDKD